MTTNIGGINVGIGANVKNVLKGFDVVDSQLRRFQKKMSDIRLASIVKGDPFSETRKHFKTVKTELNSVFNSWSKNMGYVEGSMGKFAEKSRKVTEATILHWQKVNKEFSKVKGTGEAVAKGKKFDLNLNEIVGDPDKFAQKVINPTFLKNFEKMRSVLTKIKPELKGYFDLIKTEFGNVKSGYLIRSFEGNEKIAQKIEADLESYPILDENDFSEREAIEADEIWESCYDWKERIEYIREYEQQFEFRDYQDIISCVRGKYFPGYAGELIY